MLSGIHTLSARRFSRRTRARRRLPEAMRIRQSTETEDKPEIHFVPVSDCEAKGFAELYRDNVTIEEIAHRFHRTQETVREAICAGSA